MVRAMNMNDKIRNTSSTGAWMSLEGKVRDGFLEKK